MVWAIVPPILIYVVKIESNNAVHDNIFPVHDFDTLSEYSCQPNVDGGFVVGVDSDKVSEIFQHPVDQSGMLKITLDLDRASGVNTCFKPMVHSVPMNFGTCHKTMVTSPSFPWPCPREPAWHGYSNPEGVWLNFNKCVYVVVVFRNTGFYSLGFRV